MSEPNAAERDAQAANDAAPAAVEAVPAAVEAAPAAPAPADEGIGATLARARAALGLSIEECAQQLKFSARKLEALEKERYAELPEGTFARGMLRAYARLLNLDADALVRKASGSIQVQDTSDSAVSLREPIPFSEAGKRGNVLYAVLSVAVLGVVAWIALDWMLERNAAAKLTFVPAGQVVPRSGESVAAAAAPAPAAESVPKADGTVVAPLAPVATPIPQEPPKPAPAPAATPATAAETAAAEAPAGPVPAGQRRLTLKFERDSWVELRAGNGKTLLHQTMPAGTERTLDGVPPFALTVGNASYVRLTYGDRPVALKPHARTDVAKLTLE